ncbi:MAG: LysM peptidoglycan-binding domain-containing protein [Planctomycetaceae bacterium]|nr:LysM peptidoglycan-binding domain-containing protein [Planctomycetaceae bacterium]
MTADAKVGLLLGLVFIVIIAFLVNGLPAFLQSASPQDVVINTITPPTGPDLVIDDRVMETARDLEPQTKLQQSDPQKEVALLNPTGQAVPGGQPVSLVEPVKPVLPQQPAGGQASIADPDRSSVENPAVADQPAGKPAAVKARIHVVQAGDNLTSIAQKYYGKQEGARQLVIEKLYQANSKVLASPAKLRVGDKLTVPQLNELLGTAPAPNASKSLLNKFSGLLEPTPKEDAKQISEYVVKQGDSLWGIAERTLGEGKRYKEILQANRDKIKSADDVTAGMRLKIPN